MFSAKYTIIACPRVKQGGGGEGLGGGGGPGLGPGVVPHQGADHLRHVRQDGLALGDPQAIVLSSVTQIHLVSENKVNLA